MPEPEVDIEVKDNGLVSSFGFCSGLGLGTLKSTLVEIFMCVDL